MIPNEAHFKVRVLGHCLAFDARRELGLRLFCLVRRGCATLSYGRLECPSLSASLPKPTESVDGVFPLSNRYSCVLPLPRRPFVKSRLSLIHAPQAGPDWNQNLHWAGWVRSAKGKFERFKAATYNSSGSSGNRVSCAETQINLVRVRDGEQLALRPDRRWRVGWGIAGNDRTAASAAVQLPWHRRRAASGSHAQEPSRFPTD